MNGCGSAALLPDEAADGGLQIDDGTEDAMLEPAPAELGEEAFDGISGGPVRQPSLLAQR